MRKMNTPFTTVLGSEHPIVQAPMAGGATTPELVAAVSNAGNYREIAIPLAFTPLNAAFVAGLYLAGTLGLIPTLFACDRADARPFLIGTAVVTTLLLTVTGLR